MSHFADERQRRAARQARVCVQTDDIAHAGGRLRRPAADGHEARVPRSAQQEVELVKLAALAFPSHPASLGSVPKALAMQQQEPIVAVHAAVHPVQPRDTGGGGGQQLRVLRSGFGGRVHPIAEQREANVAVLSGQVMNLDSAYRFIDARNAGQQDRHGYHRAQLRGNSVHELEAGQHSGVAEMGHPKIHDADGYVGRRQECERHDGRRGKQGGTRRPRDDAPSRRSSQCSRRRCCRRIRARPRRACNASSADSKACGTRVHVPTRRRPAATK